jgi:hypothetical protein
MINAKTGAVREMHENLASKDELTRALQGTVEQMKLDSTQLSEQIESLLQRVEEGDVEQQRVKTDIASLGEQLVRPLASCV